MSDNPRIEDLRRRVLRDPASIAFAQLAEEYRRAGDCEEAVRVCEAGLAQHPAYLSARVTLGRALFELGRLEDARTEFLRVLDAAPDNLIAVGKLAEIHQRTQQVAYRRSAEESTQVSPGQGRDIRSVDERIVAELQGWLDV
ncbi:MAG TPA: tetratricopeptide repeat protein, partial [Vicinamibacterales bacterium]|nr:tetratricopeptide repeat protein [Vicinamibacterales bacterium]